MSSKFLRNLNVHFQLGVHTEYRHQSEGKLIAHRFGVAVTGDVICTGPNDIKDFRLNFEMAVVDYETLAAGKKLMSNEEVRHAAVDRLWTTTEASDDPKDRFHIVEFGQGSGVR